MAFSLAFTQSIYVFLLIRDKVALGQHEFVPASFVADTLAIPKPSVVKILKALSRAGILVTGTGVNGGARLADGARQRSLYDLFLAVEGAQPFFRRDHDFPAQGLRPDLARQAVHRVLTEVEEATYDALRAVPLGSLVPSEPGTPVI